jgi:hypothetical protein
MKVNPGTIASMNGNNDSAYVFVSVPAVKSYTGKVKFIASVTPAPPNGTITLSFHNKSSFSSQDTLTTYPDSLRLRIRTTGGVTQQSYTVNVIAHGKIGNIEQTPVHLRQISLSVITGIHNYNNEVPDVYYLYQNFPNPFNPQTNIRFDIAKAGHVKVVVYDVTGKQVAELVNGNYNAGKYITDFDARNYSSGIYFYKIETADYVNVKKMILIK